MAQTVIGIFNTASEAQAAVEQLIRQGFNRGDIDMVTRGNSVADDMTSDRTNPEGSTYRGDTTRTTSGDDTVAHEEGFGDRIGRFFRNLFDDDDESTRYTNVARNGTVVTVHAHEMEEARQASEILDENGAIDVNSEGNRASISSMSERDADRTSLTDTDRTTMTGDDTSRSIPVIEEELQVSKREVERGGVRLRSRIIERPVEESLRLREERVTVERNPVNRPATEADFQTFREGEVELRERAEVPVVNREARVVEEVNIRKDVEEREEVVRDTVRNTDVEVEKLSDSDTTTETSRTRRKK